MGVLWVYQVYQDDNHANYFTSCPISFRSNLFDLQSSAMEQNILSYERIATRGRNNGTKRENVAFDAIDLKKRIVAGAIGKQVGREETYGQMIKYTERLRTL